MLFQRLWAHVHLEMFCPEIRNKAYLKRLKQSFMNLIIRVTFVPEISDDRRCNPVPKNSLTLKTVKMEVLPQDPSPTITKWYLSMLVMIFDN